MFPKHEQQPSLWQESQTAVIFLTGFIGFLWFVELVDWLLFDGQLDKLGIRPRSLSGLAGILYAPFLHGGFGHLMTNSVPILVLGGLIIFSRQLNQFFKASLIIIVISGLGTWLIGPSNSVHIGASGLIFGYFGFLLLVAYFERSLQAILIAGLVLFMYSGLVWGILPGSSGISWQSHLFGLIGGMLAAYLLAQTGPRPSVEHDIIIHDSFDI